MVEVLLVLYELLESSAKLRQPLSTDSLNESCATGVSNQRVQCLLPPNTDDDIVDLHDSENTYYEAQVYRDWICNQMLSWVLKTSV